MTQEQMSHDCGNSRSQAGGRPSRNQRGNGRGAGKGAGAGAGAGAGGVRRDGQGSRKVTFPWINDQIITAANTEDINHLLLTINAHLEQMNLVNLSTALHRVAKLSGYYHARQQVTLQQTLHAMLAAVKQALIRAEETGSTPKCQALSNITWAMATMQVVDLPLLEMMVPRACSQLADFKNFELCQLLWAFAKLGTVIPALSKSTSPLFITAADFCVRHLDQFSFRGLVMTSWAFATAKQPDNRLFRAIATRLVPSVHGANCQELANTVWAFSTAGVYEERLFGMIAQVACPRVREFKPQELSSILWSFASIGYNSDHFYDAAGRAATQMDLQAQQLANILWALAKMRPRHESTKQVLLHLLPWCTALIGTFKTQELASVALAASKCFGTTPGSDESKEIFQPVPFQAAAFFHAALPMAVPNLQEYSGQSLANIASSFLAVQIGTTSGLFAGVSYEIINRAESLENSALMLLLKTLPQAPRSPPVDSALCQLFAEAARRVDSLSEREVQSLANICAKPFGGSKDVDMHNATPENREDLRVWLLTLANTWGSPDIYPSHNSAAAAAGAEEADTEAADEEDVNATLERWAPSITMSIATSFRDHHASAWDEQAMVQLRNAVEATAARREEANPAVGDPAPVLASQQAPPKQNFVFSVKNTFLDVEEEGSDKEGSDSELMQMPPALPFIPDSVSAEKLHAYRANYARFRVGNAIGAKGELDTVS